MESMSVASRRVRVETTDGRGGRDETDVRYLVSGTGPPVVLLHGIGLDSATVSWRHLSPELAAERTVYAPDLPGHAESGRPSVRYTTGYFRSVLESFLEKMGLETAPLVGISMGGCLALGHALDNPVERLVLVDSYGLGTDAPWRPAATAMLGVPGAYSGWWATIGSSRGAVRSHLETLTDGSPTDSHVEDVYRAVQDAAVGRTVSSWQRSEFRYGGLETCYLDRLDELTAETLLVHGTEDPLLPASWSERAAERTGASLELMENCGHWPSREAPERFNETVRAFL
jgi:pimeloyl-ACP methyl ester carboxylesterase